MTDFDGKFVVVTGTGSKYGRSHALEREPKCNRINILAPDAFLRTKEGLHDSNRKGRPDQVGPAAFCLCSESTPQGIILQVADRRFSNIRIISENPIDLGDDVSYEDFLAAVVKWDF